MSVQCVAASSVYPVHIIAAAQPSCTAERVLKECGSCPMFTLIFTMAPSGNNAVNECYGRLNGA